MMVVGTLSPIIERLERRGLRRGYAITTVFAGLFLSFALFCALTIPRFAAQILEIVGHLPQTQARVADELARSKWGAPLAESLRQTNSTQWIAKLEAFGLSYSSRAAAVIAYAVSSLFLAMYLIIHRDEMRGTLFALIPRAHHVEASRVLLNLEEIVGGYMRGQVITSVLMAVFTFIVLSIAGVPNALALATLAGTADVLPYVGTFLACGPAFLASLPRELRSTGVLAALAAYQGFESRFIVPRVYGKVLRLPAATVMVALLAGGELFGILGALLALPVAAGLRTIIHRVSGRSSRRRREGVDSMAPETARRERGARIRVPRCGRASRGGGGDCDSRLPKRATSTTPRMPPTRGCDPPVKANASTAARLVPGGVGETDRPTFSEP